MPTRPELPIPELHGDSRDSVPKAQLRGGNRINAPFITDLADDLFPKTYHELTNELLEHLEEEDPELLVRIFERRRQRRVEAARKRLAGKTFDEKVAVLARILDEDGYFADFEGRPDGTYLIREQNCAIWGVAVRYGLACSTELEFLQEAFPEAQIDPRHPQGRGRLRVRLRGATPRSLKKNC